MGAFLVIVLQVVLAVLVAGMALPALLIAVPALQTQGPLVLAAVVGLVFILVRIVWPRKKS